MSNLWKQQGIPHKGWTLEYVYDVRGDGQSENEASYEICMMCGKERIRYVHVVSHPPTLPHESFRVALHVEENDNKHKKIP